MTVDQMHIQDEKLFEFFLISGQLLKICHGIIAALVGQVEVNLSLSME